MICDHRLTQIETVNNKGKNIVGENILAKPFNLDPRQGMFIGMIQIVTAHKWYLYPPIILGTPFINVIYPFTSINAKGFSATFEDRDISYTFITESISRYINALINMKQRHGDSFQLELFSINIFDTMLFPITFATIGIRVVTIFMSMIIESQHTHQVDDDGFKRIETQMVAYMLDTQKRFEAMEAAQAKKDVESRQNLIDNNCHVEMLLNHSSRIIDLSLWLGLQLQR
ncbi:hypothetical protein H5410_046001 [Solanum commersonii]|uniref:Uncharacterized protein n=1 Tax=Solanum commersonii TaxID=4109 RepID=A0A9J5XD89_SOLCO|nr:hypothetical protein H5410_046001 [Solanum commersonii]